MIVSERIKNITKVVEQLDISPSLYRNAVEKYNNLAKFLCIKYLQKNIVTNIVIYSRCEVHMNNKGVYTRLGLRK